MAIGWKKDYFRYKDFFLNIVGQYKVKPNLKKYLELILSIFTIGLFAVFAIRPTILTIIELQKQITEKENTIGKLEQKIKNLQTGSNNLQLEASRLPIILDAVPNSAKPQVLVKQIESLALKNSLTIMSFSASDAVLVGTDENLNKSQEVQKLPDNASDLPFTISVTGSYEGLFSFITDMQKMRRPVQIDSFAINSNLKENEKVLVLIISGRVPFLISKTVELTKDE